MRAAVIGSGFGGLSLAIRLQTAGIQTTVFEARDLPGGRAYVYKDKGYTFDAGPTVITDPSALEELFEGAGRKLSDYVELLPVAPFYRLCWEDGDVFDYVNDQDELDRQIVARNLMVDVQSDPVPPSVGDEAGDVENGGRRWHWSRTVKATDDQRLLQVDLTVDGQPGASPVVLSFIRVVE